MDDIGLIECLYNPLRRGAWVLDFKLDEKDHFLRSFTKEKEESDIFLPEIVFELIIKLLDEKNKGSPQREKDTPALLGLKLIEKEGKEEEGMSSDALLFRRIPKDFKKEDYAEYLGAIDGLKDFVKLKAKRRSADSLFLSLKTNEFFRIGQKGGFFTRDIRAVSYDRGPLDKLIIFLKKISRNIKYKIEKRYYPEDLVFSNYPYLMYNKKIWGIFTNKEFVINLHTSLEEFNSGKILSSIGDIGMAMEEILTEIYVTCIRESLDSRGLGNMLEKLNSETQKILIGGEKEPTYKDFFTELKSSEIEAYKKTMKKGIIMILQEILEIKKNFGKLEKFFKKIPTKSYLFPEQILEYMMSTVDYRNRSSHRKSGELGEFEFSLSFRGLMALILWWEFVKKSIITWDSNKEDMLKEILSESNNFFDEEKIKEKFDL